MSPLGWFTKIFGIKESNTKKEELKPTTFGIESLKTFLDTQHENITNPFFKLAKTKHDELQTLANDLQGSLKILSEAKYTDSVDPQLFSAVMERRKNFIQKINAFIKKLRTPISSDFNSILDFHNSSVSTFNHANDTTVDDYRRLTELFRRETSLVINNFKKIENSLTDFGLIIKDKGSIIKSLNLAKSKLQEITNHISAFDEKKKHIEETADKIDDLDSEHVKILNGISALENSDEWRSYNNLLKKRDEAQNKIIQLSNTVIQTVSPLIKPIKKFKHLIDNGVVSFDKKFVELFLENNSDAILRKDSSNFLSLLENLEKTISDKKIDLKDRTNTILDTITALKESNVIFGLKNDFETLSKDTMELESKIASSQVPEKRKKLAADLESVKRTKDNYNLELSKEKSNLESLRNDIHKARVEIEEQIANLSGNKVSLEVPVL